MRPGAETVTGPMLVRFPRGDERTREDEEGHLDEQAAPTCHQAPAGADHQRDPITSAVPGGPSPGRRRDHGEGKGHQADDLGVRGKRCRRGVTGDLQVVCVTAAHAVGRRRATPQIA